MGLVACCVALAACMGNGRSSRIVEKPSPRSPARPPALPACAPHDVPAPISGAAQNAEVPPAPEPLFASRTTVSYRELVEEVRRVADELVATPEVKRSYQAFLVNHELSPSDVSITSYSRVRLVFEATRDGGLWGVKWEITDRMPWSDAVWKQWSSFDFGEHDADITAVAECDELSALFAFLARDVGIEGFVGLFWPAWNHTVAVWELRRGATPGDPGTRVRVMVPTSQVWLSREATLGSREFETNRAVFPTRLSWSGATGSAARERRAGPMSFLRITSAFPSLFGPC